MVTRAQRVSATLFALLEEAVRHGVSPGAVSAFSIEDGEEPCDGVACAGRLEPLGEPVHVDTLYDLASLTKPVVATAAMRLWMRDAIDFHVPVERYLPELTGTPGGQASLDALLSHRAGLSPWGGLYKEIRAPVGSSETRAFMLLEAARRVDPSPPSDGSVYSDLGYLIAGEALARAQGCSLDKVVESEVTAPLGLQNTLFYMATRTPEERERLRRTVAPTEHCAWRGHVIRAEVHDENCAAFGGIAGHAGLFGDAASVRAFGAAVLSSLRGDGGFLDRELLSSLLSPRPGGGHVVGWDTKSEQGSSAGALFGARSFGHLGFTGTSLWCDPDRRLVAVLLTNRVFKTRDNVAIRAFRPRFHDALVNALS